MHDNTSMLSMAGAVLAVVCILLLAYWCSRMLSKTWVKTSYGKHMKVIEQLHLGTDKQLLLLKIQDKTYLIGVSQSGIRMLTEVEGEFEEMQMSHAEVPKFQEFLKKYAAQHQKKEGQDHE